MTRDQIAELMDRRRRAWAAKNPIALASDHALDGTVDSALAGLIVGRPAIEGVYRLWFEAFPDLQFQVDDLLMDGNRTAVLWTISGTQRGRFLGLAATDQHLQISGVSIYYFEGTQIARERRFIDLTGVLIRSIPPGYVSSPVK